MKTMICLVAIAAASTALAHTSLAQPKEVLEFHQRMGGGELLLTFCLVGDHVCVERRAIIYGQICDSEAARSIGTGESGEYEGSVPPLFHYAGFRCGYSGKWHPKTDSVSGGGNWMD